MLKNLLILSPFLLCALFTIFVPLINSENADLTALHSARLAPSLQHFFGTDFLGRDLFLRLANALRTSFLTGFLASFLSLVLAIFYVFLARLTFYNAFIRALDALLALPALLVVMFCQSFLGGSLSVMIAVIALTHWCVIAKSLDSEVTRFSKSDFYLCALGLGASKFKLLWREVLPASANLLLVLFILNVAHAISNEATLSFFNLGVGVGEACLGVLLNEASRALFIGDWWLILLPLLALLMMILPLLALANLLQDRLGVKL